MGIDLFVRGVRERLFPSKYVTLGTVDANMIDFSFQLVNGFSFKRKVVFLAECGCRLGNPVAAAATVCFFTVSLVRPVLTCCGLKLSA